LGPWRTPPSPLAVGVGCRGLDPFVEKAGTAPKKEMPFMSQEARVRELSERHKRLEAAIAAELKHPAGDDLRIHELKRKKLRIKDELTQLRTN
jgi:hypothetical protein